MSERSTVEVPGPRAFAGNAVWSLTAQIGAKVASFALVVILARGLGAEDYGLFNFAVSFVPLFLVIGTWGIDVAVVRAIARDRERLSEVFSSGLALRAGLGAAALALSVTVASVLVASSEALLAVVVVGIALLLDELSSYVGTVFKAFERMRLHALVILVNRLVSTVLAAAAVAAGKALALVLGMYLAGSAGALVFAWVTLARRFPPIALRDARRPVVGALLKEGGTVGLASVLNMATFRVDTVMLQAIRGPVAVAMYGVAYRFFESFLFVVWSLANVALPRIARAETKAGSARTFEMTTAMVLCFYLPLAVGAYFAGEWVVVAVFSERYVAAARAVPWLMAAGVFYALAHLARISFVGLGERKPVVRAAAITLVFNIATNAIAIPRYGFLGAAATTLASEIIEASLLLGGFLVHTRVKLGGLVAAPVAASATMAAVLALSGARDLAAVVVGAPVYVGSLALAGRALAPREAREVMRMLRRRDMRQAPGV